MNISIEVCDNELFAVLIRIYEKYNNSLLRMAVTYDVIQ